MEPLESSPLVPLPPTHEDILEYFNIIRKKYYFEKGYLTTTLPDALSEAFIANNPSIIWHETYNQYASEYVPILYTDIFVSVFGQKFTVRLERPIKQDHHCEFEDYFCFGGHNLGFTTNRIVVSFAKSFDPAIDVASVLSSCDVIDETYATHTLLFLLFGGYIKVWSGFYAYNNWFTSKNIGLVDLKTSDIVHKYILENYELPVPVPVPVPATEPATEPAPNNEPATEPAAESAPAPAAAPAPESAPESAAEPAPAPNNEPAAESAPAT
jgi:hypothetical protein